MLLMSLILLPHSQISEDIRTIFRVESRETYKPIKVWHRFVHYAERVIRIPNAGL